MEPFIFQPRVSNSKWNLLFLSFELITQKWKNKSLIFELPTRSETERFTKSSKLLKSRIYVKSLELVTQIMTSFSLNWFSNSILLLENSEPEKIIHICKYIYKKYEEMWVNNKSQVLLYQHSASFPDQIIIAKIITS